MALIKCSNCGKEISDKAKACPQCGQPLFPEEISIKKTPILCDECGSEIAENMEACPNCGCPISINDENVKETPQKVEVTSVKLPKIKQKTKKYIIIITCVLLAIIIALFVGKNIKEQKLIEAATQRSIEYANTLETISHNILLGAIEAEKAGNLIKKVWQNAIYEEYDSETNDYTRPNGYYVDFNDALGNLFKDSSFKKTISSIESNQELVMGFMKDLKNPPTEYEEAYETVKELYDAYTALTNLATNPTGSLTTFSQNFNKADTDVANCYDEMKLYID